MWIQTVTGKKFSFENIDCNIPDIRDIAKGLSNICRFAGQINQFYSVAEHSVRLSGLVPPYLAKAALFHDASEAYMNDIPSPLKKMLPDYRAIELSVTRRLFNCFNIPFHLSYDEELKRMDRNLGVTEACFLMNYELIENWNGYGEKIKGYAGISPLPPADAYMAFLERFYTLNAI